jgi:hypothetical protein
LVALGILNIGLLAAFADIAESVTNSRKTREERLKRAQEKQDK